MRPAPMISRRSNPIRPLPSSSHPPPPPPPPPLPTLIQPFKQPSTSTAHDRVKPFRLIDPTEDLLRALRARREKLDAEATAAEEASEVRSEAAGAADETLKSDANCNNTIDEVASATDNSVVDAIVQRFLAEHPDASEEKEASRVRQDGETQKGDDQRISDATNCNAFPCTGSIEDDDAVQHCNHMLTVDAVDTRSQDYMPRLQEDVPALQVCSYEAADDEEVGMCRAEYHHRMDLPTFEEGKLEQVADCLPSTEAVVEGQTEEAEHKQVVSLVKKQQSKRRGMNSIVILDSCRVESFRMIRSALVQLCRKAAAASLRTLGKAKRKVTRPSHRDPRSLEVVAHRDASATLDGSVSNRQEKAAVRDLEAIPQNKLKLPHEQQSEVQNFPASPPTSSTELHQEKCATTVKQDTPISSPTRLSSTACQATLESNEPKVITSSPPPHSVRSLDLQAIMENIPKHDIFISPDSLPVMQEDTQEPRLSHVCSARHVYAKSLGGDEPNEFYDASSRFGSQSSTPSRINLNRSMSREWGHADDFLDATSTPFETPRTSVSENRYSISASSPSWGPSNRPTSKLSKRVGKALWVDTREMNATGKVDALPVKNFYSGELFTTSKESTKSALKMDEPHYTRRKCVSGDQASSSSTSQARRHNTRGASSSQNGRSTASQVIAVTPVFPSKCQKNRSIASASGLPRQMLTEDMQDVGWPLGISGYPPLKTCAKERAERKLTKKGLDSPVVPSPPLPPSPAGGSWLRKALSSNARPSRLAALHASSPDPAKKPPSPSSPDPTPLSPDNKWEDIVKGSHVQPGHLRFSEELHHHPPDITSNKYYVS